LAVYYFLPPLHSLAIGSLNPALSLALFLLTGLVITIMASALRTAYREAETMQRQTAAAHAQAEQARSRAEASERERHLLLIDFGHRVKNDMQRITSSLRLQAAHSSPEVAAALQQAANQVKVIASIHDRLTHCDGEVLVNMDDFLRDLISELRASMAEVRPIGLFVEAENHLLPLDRVGAVGLVANELITNALKHAFPDDRSGNITVRFCRKEPDFLLTVADDGVGLPSAPQGEPQPRRGGLGQRLTRALAAQLGGRIEVARNEPAGMAYILRFPITQPGLPAARSGLPTN
jgi:two-component sensor histidine kinase